MNSRPKYKLAGMENKDTKEERYDKTSLYSNTNAKYLQKINFIESNPEPSIIAVQPLVIELDEGTRFQHLGDAKHPM